MQTFNSAFVMHLYGSGSSQLKGYLFNNNITVNGRFLCGSGGSPVTDVTISNGIHGGAGQMEIGQIGPSDPDHNNFHIDDYQFWDSTLQIKKGRDFTVLDNEFD